ncbi:MAG: ceramidase domain-containing protein [Deltaproteobacteria bacterium]|nr:ceramidase domain-containing protein [Deltaproteobacteria bacterium]
MAALNDVPALPEGCPWADWARPNIDWCEEELCAWIVNPADTWSNLPMVAVGIWMIFLFRRHPEPLMRWFGPMLIFLGLSSFAFHGSYTFFFQFFDFVGMFLFIFLPLVLNLRRTDAITPGRARWLYLGGSLLFSALVPLGVAVRFPIQLLVLGLILFVVGQEIWIRLRTTTATNLGLFLWACLFLGAAATLSALDLSRVWCNPTDHLIQGHAFWHILCAVSFTFLAVFYARQPSLGAPADG